MIVEQGRQHFIVDAREAERLSFENLLESRSTIMKSLDGRLFTIKSDVGFSTSNFAYPYSGPFTLDEIRVEMSRDNNWGKLFDEGLEGGTF